MRSVLNSLSILVLVCLKGLALAQEPPRLELVLQTGHTGGITSVALSGDGRYVVTGSGDQTAILWEAATGKQLQTFPGHTDAVTSVALSGDGKHLWTASADGPTRLWDPATGKERCRLYSFDAGKDWLVVTPEDCLTVPKALGGSLRIAPRAL